MSRSRKSFQSSATISNHQKTCGLKNSQVHWLWSLVVWAMEPSCLSSNSHQCEVRVQTTIKTSMLRPSSSLTNNKPKCSSSNKFSYSSRCRVGPLLVEVLPRLESQVLSHKPLPTRPRPRLLLQDHPSRVTPLLKIRRYCRSSRLTKNNL